MNVSTEGENSGEDTADWEHSVRVVMTCRAGDLAIALYILIVTNCKFSIHRITDPNPVYIVTLGDTWQYCELNSSDHYWNVICIKLLQEYNFIFFQNTTFLRHLFLTSKRTILQAGRSRVRDSVKKWNVINLPNTIGHTRPWGLPIL
jgi:hypothetical protein